MADKLNRQQIYKSRLNDLWEILENKNGYFWRRTASNNEIVGGSHISFKTKRECEDNARLVGYEEQYNQPSDATWEFYQDGKKEYRWRLYDGEQKLNVCHEGYKSELSAQKNAIRHGWGQKTTSPAKATAPVACDASCECSDDNGCNAWFLLPLLMILGALLGWLLHSQAQMPTPSEPVEIVPKVKVQEQIFNDVPNTAWHSDFVNKLAKEKLINGYRTLDGAATGDFGPDDSITLAQLAKMAVNASGKNVRTCGSLLGEPDGYEWSAPFIKCAQNAEWTVFQNEDEDYNRPATRAEIASIIVDAFKVEDNPAASFRDVDDSTLYGRQISTIGADGIMTGYKNSADVDTGIFGPSDNVTRAQTAKVFCGAMEKYVN